MNYKVKFKKNDNVVLTCGKDIGKKGSISFINIRKGRAVVEGLNMVKKHSRPTQRNQKGGIVDIAAPVHISNMKLICPKCSKSTRVKRRRMEDGKVTRVCKKCDEIIDKGG